MGYVSISISLHTFSMQHWITTCVLLHAFAMEHEGGIDLSADQFYQKGQELMQHERAERENRLVERERHATASQEEWEVERDI